MTNFLKKTVVDSFWLHHTLKYKVRFNIHPTFYYKMIMQKDIKDISWLEKGYGVVVKIANDIDKLEQRAVELTTQLKKKENVVHDIQKGVYILDIIARSIDSDGINKKFLPAEYPTDYEIFVNSIAKRLTVHMDSLTISLLFQKKGSDWFRVWDRMSAESRQDIGTICDALLPNYQNLLDELRAKTEATRKEHLLVRNDISQKVERIKKYRYYATKAFKVGAGAKTGPEAKVTIDRHQEASRKRRTEVVENTAVSLMKKKQKTYGHVETLMLNDYTKRLKAKFEGNLEVNFTPHESRRHLISCLRSIVPSDDEDVAGNLLSHRVATVMNVVNGIYKSSSYYFESESDLPQQVQDDD